MPKIVDKDKRRAEIAQKAMELFAEQGFDRTSVSLIARHVGMGKGTFYEYFQDKNDILDETAKLLVAHWTELMGRAQARGSDPLDSIGQMVKAGVRAARDFEQATMVYMELWRMAVQSGRNVSYLDRISRFIKASRLSLARLVGQGLRQGCIRSDVSPDAVAFSFIAIVDGIALHAAIYRSDFDAQALWNGALEQFVESLRPK